MKNIKLKVYLNDGTYFWIEANKEGVKARFNNEVYHLIDKNEYDLKFKSESSEEILNFEISKNNNRNVLEKLNEYYGNE